jgi:hypothetical protein
LDVFWKEFDLKSHQTLPKKTFQEKADSEWAGRAAFPGPKRRAGVLTDRCLSTRQVETALSHTGCGMFSSAIHRAIAMWFVGFSGFYTPTVQRIPLVGAGVSKLPDDWRAYYDVPLGILFRDYSSLAKSAASAEGLQAQPASYVFPTPAPQRIADYVRELYANTTTSADLGDLVQELRVIQPQWNLYPSTDSLSPSFAKWARTPGPLLRQLGIDALLAALITGDLGVSPMPLS